jgi:superfamily II DNA or RNA helicase
MILRHYQHQAVSNLRTAFRSGARAPLLVLPTGGGKTIILAAITHQALTRGARVLILVHRRELIHQTSAKLTALQIPHGIIAAGVDRADAPIQVASVQTLIRRLDTAAQPDLIIIDEAHHATIGSTWGKILAHWPDASRLGVTATPIRLDGRGLSETFDHLVLGPSVADLTADGFLCPSRIYAPPMAADLTGLKSRAGDYTIEQAAARMDRSSVTGDAIKHYLHYARGKSAVVFCCTVDHANHVVQQFKAANITATTLLGSTVPAERDRAINALANGKLQVLVTVDVVSEGFDCAAAEVAVLLRPTQSEGLFLQQVGRVLRPSPGKREAVVLDHVGNVHRHGFPDDCRDWSLQGRPSKTKEVAPSVRTCTICFAAFKPAPQCPVCGTPALPSPREIQQQEGELQELTRDALERARARDCRQVGQARTLDQLLAIADQRGYSRGWAYKVYQSRSS